MVTLLANTMIIRRAMTGSAMMASTAVVLPPSPDAVARMLPCRFLPGRAPRPCCLRWAHRSLLQGVADDGGGAVHLHDPHPGTDREDFSPVLAAGGPFIRADLDPAAIGVDGAGDRR